MFDLVGNVDAATNSRDKAALDTAGKTDKAVVTTNFASTSGN